MGASIVLLASCAAWLCSPARGIRFRVKCSLPPRLLSCKLENVWQHSGGRLSGSGYVSRAVTFKVKDLGCHLGMWLQLQSHSGSSVGITLQVSPFVPTAHPHHIVTVYPRIKPAYCNGVEAGWNITNHLGTGSIYQMWWLLATTVSSLSSSSTGRYFADLFIWGSQNWHLECARGMEFTTPFTNFNS